MKKFNITEDAKQDARESAKFYAEIDPKLATAFARENKQVLNRIKNNPEHFQKVYKDKARRAVSAKFKFNTFFADQPEETTVIAILHQSTNPKKWKNRADKVLKNGK